MVKTTFKKYARKNLRAYRKRKTTKKTGQVATIKKIVSKMIMKKAEPKAITNAFNLTQLYHNVGYYQHLNATTLMPTQGLGDNNRVGDQINVGGFYLRILCGQKADRANCTWKFYILRIPKGSVVSYNTMFENYTSNVLLDSPNKDKVSVLKSFTVKKLIPSTSQVNATGLSWLNKEITFPVKIWLPYKKLYKFQQDNLQHHNDHDIILCVFAYDAQGTLETDEIAYVKTVSTMYYKDP